MSPDADTLRVSAAVYHSLDPIDRALADALVRRGWMVVVPDGEKPVPTTAPRWSM